MKFDLEFTELKVFLGDEEIDGEEENLNYRVKILQHLVLNTGLGSLLGDLSKFIKLPISPYPTLESCLGLTGQSSYMKIYEGYANVGYDFKVKPASRDCLFNF